jgi:hypothetical protein
MRPPPQRLRSSRLRELDSIAKSIKIRDCPRTANRRLSPAASRFSAPSIAVSANKPDERDEPKRKSALSPGGQKGCFPQQPQAHESNAREIRERAGQLGIPSEP